MALSAFHDRNWGRAMKRLVLVTTLSCQFLLAVPATSTPQMDLYLLGGVSKNDVPNGRLIALFNRSKLGLMAAIDVAKNRGGGEFLEVSFRASGGRRIFKVKTYQNKEVWNAEVDAQSGLLLGYGSITAEEQFDRERRAEIAGLLRAKVSLAKAIQAAENGSLGARAMSAEIEETDSRITIDITMAQPDGTATRASVDPATGELLR
jgi:uncharacterized membrane protein YkoI